jgi:hypothetical protein
MDNMDFCNLNVISVSKVVPGAGKIKCEAAELQMRIKFWVRRTKEC